MTESASTSYWVHQPHPFLIQFTENFGIRYYGLAYLAGFVAAGWLLWRYHRMGRSPLDINGIFDLMTWLVAGVMVGGRLGSFLLYHPEELFDPPWAVFMIWKGGMASHGGFAGVILAMWLFARRRKIPFLPLTDIVVTTVPAGLFFGRVANFVNGELWGKPATVPWAIIFEKTGGGALPRHPSQLYEAALEGLLLFAYVQGRFWKSDCTRRQPGRLAGEFLAGYALVRIFCEIFREPDVGVDPVLGLSRGTFYSLFVLAGGLAVIAFTPRRASEHKP
jgi:phosphatidylglycerol:prolipoprotein diacylglycerol transferase